MQRTYYLRSRNAYRFAPIDGEGVGMSGLFSKLHKAISKPFTKIFKPHTLLGKIADPFGLSSRNIKFAGRVADVVGTAAAVVAGGWAIGAAAGGAGGFWATAAKGGSIVGSKLFGGAKAIGAAVKSVGAKGALTMLSASRLGGGGGGAPEAAEAPPGVIDGQVLGASSMPAGLPLMPQMSGSSTFGPPDMGPSPEAGFQAQEQAGGAPGAEVAIEAPALESETNWLLIGAGVAAVGLLIYLNRKKGR